jgi:hypothetical protein
VLDIFAPFAKSWTMMLFSERIIDCFPINGPWYVDGGAKLLKVSLNLKATERRAWKKTSAGLVPHSALRPDATVKVYFLFFSHP